MDLLARIRVPYGKTLIGREDEFKGFIFAWKDQFPTWCKGVVYRPTGVHYSQKVGITTVVSIDGRPGVKASDLHWKDLVSLAISPSIMRYSDCWRVSKVLHEVKSFHISSDSSTLEDVIMALQDKTDEGAMFRLRYDFGRSEDAIRALFETIRGKCPDDAYWGQVMPVIREHDKNDCYENCVDDFNVCRAQLA